MSRIRAVAVAGVLLAAVVAPAGVASAQTQVIKDGTGDTWQTVWDIDVWDSETYTPAGSTPNTDLTRTTVKFSRSQLVVTAAYADLAKDDAYKPELTADIRLAGGGGAVLTVFVYDSWDHPEVFFRNRPLDAPWVGRQRASCASRVTWDIDLRRDTFTTRVPTSCLGDPDWIQVHAVASAGGALDDHIQSYYQDNAHTDAAQDRLIGVTQACFSQCEGWTRKLHPTKKR